MKRYIKTLCATIGAISIMSSAALAGQWVENGGNWFYMTDDGNYAKNTWLWLDENHDTKAELYHFDANGVMAQSTVIQMGSGKNYVLVNIDGNGVATDCTSVDSPYINYYTLLDERFPKSYSIDEKYGYSLDVDHYDFAELKFAEFPYSSEKNPIKKTGNCYSADVYLYVWRGDFGNELDSFNCFIKTTAKFSKNCRVRSYDNEESFSISDFIKKKQYHNCLDVYSVDTDGYITDCRIYSAA